MKSCGDFTEKTIVIKYGSSTDTLGENCNYFCWWKYSWSYFAGGCLFSLPNMFLLSDSEQKYVIVSYLFCFHLLYSNRDGRRSKNPEALSFGSQLMNHALLFILSKFGRGVEGPQSRPDPPKNVKKPQCDCH